MQSSIANWQWLVPFASRTSAVVLAQADDAAGRPLTRGFRDTQIVDPAEWRGDAMRFQTYWSARFASGSLDCVAIPDADLSLGGWADPAPVLSGVRHSLRPGVGWCVALESITHAADRLRLMRVGWSPAVRHLRRAGFGRVLLYYVAVSATVPIHLIPADRAMLLGWDRLMERRGARAIVRRALIHLGLHAIPYPLRLIVAS